MNNEPINNWPGFSETLSEFLGVKLAYTWEAFATHQPLLIWALNHSSRAIVELGIGHYSTPLIAAVSARDRREALSLEDNAEWMKQYSGKTTGYHTFEAVTSWAETIDKLTQSPWGLVFVDQADHKMRGEAIRKLQPHCMWMVLHDSDMILSGKSTNYEWWEYFPAKQPWPERGGPPSLLIKGGLT